MTRTALSYHWLYKYSQRYQVLAVTYLLPLPVIIAGALACALSTEEEDLLCESAARSEREKKAMLVNTYGAVNLCVLVVQ
jgi:hypothetical protein